MVRAPVHLWGCLIFGAIILKGHATHLSEAWGNPGEGFQETRKAPQFFFFMDKIGSAHGVLPHVFTGLLMLFLLAGIGRLGKESSGEPA
jgi:hypothetical protein